MIGADDKTVSAYFANDEASRAEIRNVACAPDEGCS